MLTVVQDHRRVVKMIEGFDPSIFSRTHRIVMEFCSGGDLYDLRVRFEQKGTKVAEALLWHDFTQMLEGLAWLHDEKGIVHRDIKPENMLLVPGDRSHGFPDLKIADFGLADFHGVGEGVVQGTLEWQPLDRPQGRLETDVYAVGAMVHFLAIGIWPVDYDSFPGDRSKDSDGFKRWLVECPRTFGRLTNPWVVAAGNPGFRGPRSYSRELQVAIKRATTEDKTRRATAAELLKSITSAAATRVIAAERLPDWVLPPPPTREYTLQLER